MTDQYRWQEILPQPKEGSSRAAGTLSISIKAGVIRFGRKTTEYWRLRNYKSLKASIKPNEPGLMALQFCKDGNGHWILRPRGSATVVNAKAIIKAAGMESGCYQGHREKAGFVIVDFNQPIELFERKKS